MQTEVFKQIQFCEKHQCDYVKIPHPFNLGQKRSFCPDCADDLAAESEREDKRREATITQNAINTALDNAMLAPRFRHKTLENYLATTPGQLNAVESAKWFIENWKSATGLILIGNTGTGKNHLAAGIVNEFLKVPGRSALCTEMLKMIRSIKESWRKDDGAVESQVIKSFVRPDLLVVDEIGVQFESNTERLYLTEIINDRYNWMKPTILCGNLSLMEFKELVGERALDRIREGGKLVVFDWESYRKQNSSKKEQP